MLKNILQARVTIRGVRPCLWHRFGPDALPLEKQERTGVAGNDPEEWKRTVTATDDGQLYVDSSYVFGMMRDGAKHTKKGKGSIQALVAATLQIQETFVLFDRHLPDGLKTPPPTDPTQPVYLDIRGVRNPSTKARNVRYRVAASPGWQCSFTLLWDKTVVDRNQMQAVLIDAGTLVGIGNGRSIGMGRFEVAAFEVLNS
jgi:hypothetical protein